MIAAPSMMPTSIIDAQGLATVHEVVRRKKRAEPSAEAAAELVRAAKEQGLSLTGPDGLLRQLTKTVLETALNEEMTEHLGYAKHEPDGAVAGNIRNGTRAKTVLTDITGPVQIDVPQDRAGMCEPQIVRKRQRRLSEVDEVVLLLYAKGFDDRVDQRALRRDLRRLGQQETISRITDKVIEELTDWSHRPLDELTISRSRQLVSAGSSPVPGLLF
ncbi:transposase [Micromonospora sp. NPDC050795]|uniref:transposase n=1 Tax=Micromonospora sp. NPDC050795 TaxID=3364282 RepID=UPI003795E07F